MNGWWVEGRSGRPRARVRYVTPRSRGTSSSLKGWFLPGPRNYRDCAARPFSSRVTIAREREWARCASWCGAPILDRKSNEIRAGTFGASPAWCLRQSAVPGGWTKTQNFTWYRMIATGNIGYNGGSTVWIARKMTSNAQQRTRVWWRKKGQSTASSSLCCKGETLWSWKLMGNIQHWRWFGS